MQHAITRGNHKSARKHSKFLSMALEKEVAKGWEFIVPIERARELPSLALFPLGIAEQLGVSPSGEFVPKLRVTHDLSFVGVASESSVNSRVQEDELEPCMFGHALLRAIHRIVHLRRLHPSKTIWIRKEDINRLIAECTCTLKQPCRQQCKPTWEVMRIYSSPSDSPLEEHHVHLSSVCCRM